MLFIYFIFALLFSLIIIIIKSSILNLAFKVLSKDKIEIERLVLPIVLSLILFICVILSATLILINCHIPVFSTLLCVFLEVNYSLKILGYILLTYGIAILLYLLAEGYILKLVSLPYSKYKSENTDKNLSIEMFEKSYSDNLPPLIKERKQLKYGEGLIIALFSFSILFFCSILFIYIGKYIGRSLLNRYL